MDNSTLHAQAGRQAGLDWTGNSKSVYSTLGASNHSIDEREKLDFYATDANAINYLLDAGYQFPSNKILEPAAGQGHLSNRLIEFGYDVTSYDIVDRGYCDVMNFFDLTEWQGSICTNPPYKLAKEFVLHALDIIPEGQDVVMFLKLQFLEGQARRQLFETMQLKAVYVSVKRIACAKNGDFKTVASSAVAYAWYVFTKGYHGEPLIKWINK